MRKLILLLFLSIGLAAQSQTNYYQADEDLVTVSHIDSESIVTLKTPNLDLTVAYDFIDTYDNQGEMVLIYYGQEASIAVGIDWVSVSYVSGEVSFWMFEDKE